MKKRENKISQILKHFFNRETFMQQANDTIPILIKEAHHIPQSSNARKHLTISHRYRSSSHMFARSVTPTIH